MLLCLRLLRSSPLKGAGRWPCQMCFRLDWSFGANVGETTLSKIPQFQNCFSVKRLQKRRHFVSQEKQQYLSVTSRLRVFPFTVHATADTSGTGENTDRADQIGDAYAGVSHSVVNHTYVQWVNPAAFHDPPQGSFGTTRRNQCTGPGFILLWTCRYSRTFR
jgi:hypothetical protein